MVLTALMLGIAGSLHCLGMCSPLAMAVTSLRKPYFINRLVYNLGRVFTYGVLGLLISTVGSLLPLSGYQNLLSLVLGGVLIVFGLVGITSISVPVVTRSVQKITNRIKSLFSVFLSKKTLSSITLMGMLNGMLPCGLTYLALTYCLSFSSPYEGFFFMLLFGAGTLPVMLGLTSVVQLLINRFHVSFRKLTVYMMILLGILLVSRSWYVHDHHMDEVSEQTSQGDILICR